MERVLRPVALRVIKRYRTILTKAAIFLAKDSPWGLIGQKKRDTEEEKTSVTAAAANGGQNYEGG